MFRRNKIGLGLTMGLILPIIAFVVLYGTMELLDQAGEISQTGLSKHFRLRTSAIVAIGLNALLMNKFYKYRATESMRGLMIATLIYVVAWVIYFKDFWLQ